MVGAGSYGGGLRLTCFYFGGKMLLGIRKCSLQKLETSLDHPQQKGTLLECHQKWYQDYKTVETADSLF